MVRVEVDSTDVTNYVLNYEIEETFGEAISNVNLNILRNAPITIDNNQTIVIYDDSSICIFRGYIEKFESDGGRIKITGKDKMWDLIRKEITQVYDSTISPQDGVISEIFKDMVTTYGGLNADSISIQNSGTTDILTKFICNHTDIFERCKALATALDWCFYYRPDTDKVYFEPKGYSLNSNVLTIGSNVLSVPKWSYDATEMVNDLILAGAISQVQTTETGRIGTTIGYLTTGILLTQTPISVKVYADATNPPTTLKTGGLPNSTQTYFYYVDKENKYILPKPTTTFTSNDYFKIDYTYGIPTPIHVWNQTSIDTYGKFKKTIMLEDVRYSTDAQKRAQNYINLYSMPFVYTTMKVQPNLNYDIKIGQKIRIIDNINIPNVDDTLVITRKRTRYPNDYIELDIGDKQFRFSQWGADVLEELKRLKERELENQDVITEIVADDYSINLAPRYQKVQSNGTDVFVQQYQNNYTEDFKDQDFFNGGDGTWDTTNGVINLE